MPGEQEVGISLTVGQFISNNQGILETLCNNLSARKYTSVTILSKPFDFIEETDIHKSCKMSVKLHNRINI